MGTWQLGPGPPISARCGEMPPPLITPCLHWVVLDFIQSQCPRHHLLPAPGLELEGGVSHILTPTHLPPLPSAASGPLYLKEPQAQPSSL